MRNLGKGNIKRALQEAIIELSDSLRKNEMTSVIYLPDANMFTMTGTVLEQLICVGMIISQISRKTGKDFKEILNEDFYDCILPECKRILEEGKEI